MAIRYVHTNCIARDWRALAGNALDEGREAEGHEEGLQPAVGGQRGDRTLNDFEFARLYDQVVEEDGGEDDPADRVKACRDAESRRRDGDTDRHAVGEDDDGDCQQQGRYAGDVAFHPFDGQRPEQIEDRDGDYQRGKAKAAADGCVIMVPLHSHHYLSVLKSAGRTRRPALSLVYRGALVQKFTLFAVKEGGAC